MAKNDKFCGENQHIFISFAFDIFGFLTLEVVNLLKKIQTTMHSNIVSPRSMNVVFQRLDFAIRKGLAAQLVACVFYCSCIIILYVKKKEIKEFEIK
jgi:hypothetical protein